MIPQGSPGGHQCSVQTGHHSGVVTPLAPTWRHDKPPLTWDLTQVLTDYVPIVQTMVMPVSDSH